MSARSAERYACLCVRHSTPLAAPVILPASNIQADPLSRDLSRCGLAKQTNPSQQILRLKILTNLLLLILSIIQVILSVINEELKVYKGAMSSLKENCSDESLDQLKDFRRVARFPWRLIYSAFREIHHTSSGCSSPAKANNRSWRNGNERNRIVQRNQWNPVTPYPSSSKSFTYFDYAVPN